MRYLSKRNSRLGVSVLIALITLFFGNSVIQKSSPVSEKTTVKKPAPHIEANMLYSVTHVVDGDTLDVDIAGEKERIRLIGLNTPETVDPRRPVECFGKEASAKAKDILTEQKVKIETDPSQGTRDKYGRLLAYIFLPDGTLFNKMMIEEGYGHEYTYHLPYKYQIEFKAAERTARELKKGLWADGVCE
jgi:micrococcal nuclease